MASEIIDLDAIREELKWVMMPKSREAIDALLAEVEREFRASAGPTFTIEAQRKRYPKTLEEAPNRIVLYGGSIEMARRIVEALEDRIIAGSGCDNFYVLEGD
jgi:hypothetical protein